MILFPAIDIRNGKCVRLTQGRYDQEEIYGDPVEMAQTWEKKGARYLHVVDLDGARTGIAENFPVIASIVQSVNIPIQVGGGIRSIQTIGKYLEIGVSRVIIGTKAVQNDQFLEQIVERFSSKIAVSIDAKNGRVATDGWTKTTDVRAVDFAKTLETIGVQTVIYTDIAKDGMLLGPNFEEIKTMTKAVNIRVIASGGISTNRDVQKLNAMNVYGAIIGKALYSGSIQLEQLLKEV